MEAVDSHTAPLCCSARVLSNGRYSVLLGPGGGGYSALDGFAITRWTPDPTVDPDGFGIYVRDVDTDEFFRVAPAPTHDNTLHHHGAHVEFAVSAGEISARVDIAVASDADAELRQLVLHNRGGEARRLEVTTLAELALNAPGADAAHPAFSKLFVQTAHHDGTGALLAWRRPRSPDDRSLFAGHALFGAGVPDQWETDRMRFIGRGCSRQVPAAMAAASRLSGTTGNVLDPVFSLRTAVMVQPGEQVVLTAVIAAADNRDAVLSVLRRFAGEPARDTAFRTARAAEAGAEHTLGLPPAWREYIHIVEPGSPAASAPAPATSTDAQRVPAMDPRTASAPDTGTGGEMLQFFNGWGGFSQDGTEYVIRLPHTAHGPRRPPLPWVNVIANEAAGCIVSESGATYTWAVNSRENRITPWFNDPVTDPHGEALYIRDDDEGTFWSPVPGPCPGDGDYEVRHGFGYTTFSHRSHGLDQQVAVFVPTDAAVRIARVRLTNTGSERRRFTVVSYAQLVLGTHEADTRRRVVTRFDSDTRSIRSVQRDRGEFSNRVAVAAVAGTGALSWTCDRGRFMGPGGSVEAPRALADGSIQPAAGAGLDPCAVLALSFAIDAGSTIECAFILGEASDDGEADSLARRFDSVAAVNAALDQARTWWAERVGTVRIRTPSPAIDLMVNGWLAYQNLSCRMWARSAFYQSGGAFGFRDQLQDSSALLYMDPSITRRQILLHAAHQFVEGDVLHWWHPPLSKGIRTRFSDDLLWLPYITSSYIRHTGDAAILDEQVRYLRAPLLEPGTDEEFVVPEDSGTSGTLFDHCCRALERSLTRGANGLPLMGVGDWNDGMNRVGREGRGESVWLGFFLYDILHDFTAIAVARGDHGRAAAFTTYRDNLRTALNDAGWDGAWYRRAYYDNGEPLGSAASDECRIDALAQAWAVLSGAAPADRASQALDALEHHLVSEQDGIIRLLTPAFDETPNDPGYIKGYLPGVRENGGQYTHGVLWAVRALAQHGRSERAARLLEMLTPVMHGATAADAARYCVEPYVVAADVYGVAPHVGRGGWTWYTGSAGWMFRIALESILGIEIRDGAWLVLRPCIPAAWPGYSAELRLARGTTYAIHVERGAGDSRVAHDDSDPVTIPASDGALRVPLRCDGGAHRLRVHLGVDVGPRYEPR